MFECLFPDFSDLGLILGGPGDPENRLKIETNVFGMLLERPWELLFRFRMDIGRCLVDFPTSKSLLLASEHPSHLEKRA